MSIFQIAATLFALFMVYTVRLHHKKKTLSDNESFVWISIWFLFIVIALFPDLLKGISDTLHFARVFDLLLVIGLMIITVITFRSYFDQKKIEQRIEDLAREVTLRKIEHTHATKEIS